VDLALLVGAVHASLEAKRVDSEVREATARAIEHKEVAFGHTVHTAHTKPLTGVGEVGIVVGDRFDVDVVRHDGKDVGTGRLRLLIRPRSTQFSLNRAQKLNPKEIENLPKWCWREEVWEP